MAVWIFQGNPKTFDIDGYLEVANGRIRWLVKRYKGEIAVGDTVYLWRAQGDGKAPAGIVAEAIIASPVTTVPDDEGALSFWKSPADGLAAAERVGLDLVRIAGKREVLKRDWLKDDPVLGGLLILRQPNGTNYPVATEQAGRLQRLWTNTGTDWTRAEVIAALWAYDQTYGSAISKKPGSPVATVALQIGRVVGGVYNKLMNLRALDPRAKEQGKAGLSAGGEVDGIVFDEFFDTNAKAIRRDELTAAYAMLWTAPHVDVEAAKVAEAVEREARRLSQRSLAELLAAYAAREAGTPKGPPAVKQSLTATYQRDPYVIAIARQRANGRCEVPDCSIPTFTTASGETYSEVHHLMPLADGGADTIANVACVCPHHHRELHLGVHRKVIAKALLLLRQTEQTVSLM